MKSLYRFWVKPLAFSTKFNYELCGISILWIENNSFDKNSDTHKFYMEKRNRKTLFES